MSTRNPQNMKTSSSGDRKASASTYASSSRPRVPSASMADSEKRSSTTSHNRKQSASTTATERRTERREIHTKDTVTHRTRSPLKHGGESRANARSRKDSERPPRPAERTSATSKKSEETPVLPWEPQASLIPPTTAPLASRISIPPLASFAPPSVQPQPLSQLSPEVQETAIVEDLLFVFMGFEGQYVRFVDSYDPQDENQRLVGPQFRILPGLDPSLRDLTTSMLKMATHYTAVETFIEVMSREEYGAVNHALCAATRKLVKDYLTLMAQLEHQMLTNPAFTLHVLSLHTKVTSHMLFQLYTVGIELLKANDILEDEDAEDSLDESDNIENILESLKDGGNVDQIGSKKMCKGGTVLGLITKRLASMSGDPAARELLTTLLREASRPYMKMLNEWLHHGGIKDSHAEFLIKEQKSINKNELDQDYTDQYWEKRYTLRDYNDLIPPQLSAVKGKVLLAGKYLNVVRECGGVDVSKVVQDVPLTFDDPRFLDNVNSAYAYANSALFNLLLTTHALPARLRSLKHYFFLDRSDFLSFFLELGSHELRKPAKQVNVSKLQTFLDVTLRQPGSVAAEDPYKEDVKVEMNSVGLTNWLMKIVNVTGMDTEQAQSADMAKYLTPAASASVTDDKDITGYEALVLDYTMPFPLSLVVSRVTLTRYQLLFRYLLSLRHLETQLALSWTDHSKGRPWRHRSKNPKLEMWKRKAWTLRARMLVFVQQLLYYCTAEVIEPNWVSLMSRLKEEDEDSEHVKRTVDELMQDHVDFLATCLKECMLTNSKLLRINSKILQTCTMFANFTHSLSRSLIAADPDLASETFSSSDTPHNHSRTASSSTTHVTYEPGKIDKLNDILTKYEDNFARHLKILLDTLNYLAATETVVFLSLCARLSTAGEGTGEGGAGMYR